MNKVILIRFNEIHLKGGNKKYFIKLLCNNIKEALNSVCKDVELFAKKEGLTAHAKSAVIRCED